MYYYITNKYSNGLKKYKVAMKNKETNHRIKNKEIWSRIHG